MKLHRHYTHRYQQDSRVEAAAARLLPSHGPPAVALEAIVPGITHTLDRAYGRRPVSLKDDTRLPASGVTAPCADGKRLSTAAPGARHERATGPGMSYALQAQGNHSNVRLTEDELARLLALAAERRQRCEPLRLAAPEGSVAS